jgi:hypothetical protein
LKYGANSSSSENDSSPPVSRHGIPYLMGFPVM